MDTYHKLLVNNSDTRNTHNFQTLSHTSGRIKTCICLLQGHCRAALPVPGTITDLPDKARDSNLNSTKAESNELDAPAKASSGKSVLHLQEDSAAERSKAVIPMKENSSTLSNPPYYPEERLTNKYILSGQPDAECLENKLKNSE